MDDIPNKECIESILNRIRTRSQDVEKAYQEELIKTCSKWCRPSLWTRFIRWINRKKFDDLYPFKTKEEKDKAMKNLCGTIKVIIEKKENECDVSNL